MTMTICGSMNLMNFWDRKNENKISAIKRYSRKLGKYGTVKVKNR